MKWNQLLTRESQTKEGNMQRHFSGVSIRQIDDATRQVELSFSSEEPYERWFGPEILSHEPGAVDLTRINEIGCLLYNHNRDKVIGRIDEAWLDGNRAKALVTFDDDESDKIYKKVKSGTLKGVSVGYQVDSWEEVQAGKVSSNNKFIGPCSIALRWYPYEISIVSIPADPSVGVGRSRKKEEEKQHYNNVHCN
ncbi:HK97 family phage prohead protease [Rummeliibacillus stabekisii]|uniref:HK97 family phage prohead protease n=1 Tax=Rummeliibacillus stabekisii TaxID=241244 RepID=UPI000A014E56|nr:HK97 family phage prohead protease [Rummeliibacillus stabekisii]